MYLETHRQAPLPIGISQDVRITSSEPHFFFGV